MTGCRTVRAKKCAGRKSRPAQTGVGLPTSKAFVAFRLGGNSCRSPSESRVKLPNDSVTRVGIGLLIVTSLYEPWRPGKRITEDLIVNQDTVLDGPNIGSPARAARQTPKVDRGGEA